MLEPCDAKVSCTVLRGLGDRKVAWLLGNFRLADDSSGIARTGILLIAGRGETLFGG